MATVTVLDDFETWSSGNDGCVLITTEAGNNIIDEYPDLMRDIICAETDEDIINTYEDTNVTYKKKDLYVAQIGIRELLDCWNKVHGTNY